MVYGEKKTYCHRPPMAEIHESIHKNKYQEPNNRQNLKKIKKTYLTQISIYVKVLNIFNEI